MLDLERQERQTQITQQTLELISAHFGADRGMETLVRLLGPVRPLASSPSTYRIAKVEKFCLDFPQFAFRLIRTSVSRCLRNGHWREYPLDSSASE